MGLLQKVTQQYDKAEESYSHLLNIKELYYGETSPSIVVALKNLGAVQTSAGKQQEAMVNL